MAQSLLTKESPEIRQFFRNIDTLSRLLDIQAEKFRPLLNGDRYMTDSELAGKLKLTRRTLADYRLNGKIPDGFSFPWQTAHDTYARTDCRISLPCLPYNAACTWIVHECRRTSLPYNFLQDHSYRISILTCKDRLLPSIGQGGPPDWLEGKNHPRFAPVFFPSKPCAITAKSKPGHIRRNTGFCQVGHV